MDANIAINFSEPVNVAGAVVHDLVRQQRRRIRPPSRGGPTNFTLNPDVDFTGNEACTVTIIASQVTDQDLLDPPDNMAANFTFSFTTLGPPTFIHDIQGASHISPMNGQLVTNVNGIVTAKRSNGFLHAGPKS